MFAMTSYIYIYIYIVQYSFPCSSRYGVNNHERSHPPHSIYSFVLQILRNSLKLEASLSNFPASPDDGIVVYEGKDSECEDEDENLEAGERYFYSAFTYHSESGWSLVTWSAVDSTIISPINANLAAYKQVTSNMPTAAAATDGSLDSALEGTNGNQVGDKLNFMVDLKSVRDIAEVHIFQHGNPSFHLLTVDVAYSEDGTTWKKAGKLSLDLSHPGLVGGVLTVENLKARYIEIEGYDQASHYWGIAEIEIYSHKRPPSPLLKVVSGINLKTSAKVSWTNPDKLMVRVVRQTLVGAGSLKNFPTSPDVGIKVYEGKGTSVEDKDLPTDVQQFYSVFAFHPETGWSALHWDGVDTTLIGEPNPNLAIEKKATSSIYYNSAGPAHKVVDGSYRNGDLYVHNGAKVDDYVWVVVDLKRKQSIRNLVIWQSHSIHFSMRNAKIKLSDNGKDWKSMGSSSMMNTHTGALGTWFDFPAGTEGQYVRVEVSGT